MSLNAGDHLQHLQETFNILREHNMKLNPEKCALGVSSGKFLGFLVSQRGIEVNPDKIKAIEDIPVQLSNVKEVQRLIGRLTALSRFIFRSSKKCHRFFALLKNKNNCEWTPECEQALKELKKYLSSPPLLSKPKEGETLLVYLTVSEVAISAGLVQEDKGTQSPIYYISKILTGGETCYPHLEKLALAPVVAAQKLRPYFQCHPIALSGTIASGSQGGNNGVKIDIGSLVLIYGRSFKRKRVRARNSLDHAFGGTLRQAIRTLPLTNNEAKYEALIAGLKLARGLDSEVIKIECDSQLAVNEVYGIFFTKEENNAEADALANLGSSTEIQGPESGTVVQLMNSILDTVGYYEVNSTSLVWDWRNEIIDYLEHGKLPKVPEASRALRAKAARCSFKKGQLYRKSFEGPLARYLGASEANYVMKEVHEGICGNHSGADSLVLKLVRAGYYWPRMEQDAKDFVRKCDKCQHYVPLVQQPVEPLHSVLSPWPFMKWGMDIVGPLPPAPGKVRFGIPKEIACDNGLQFIGAKVTKFLEDKEDHLFTVSSERKFSSGVTKQSDYSESQEKVGSIKRQLARRITWHSMGLPNNGKIKHWRNPFFPYVRRRSFDTGGSRGTNLKVF
ncbi:PREDICTED: uncharacterized protein LOC109233648 [Nicotiana attenuata]|uniref:uncharacterized protein LOC109233648 n=1 Tax=Nicotiana attenuata TaxID=49451 RepID=UPI0009046524|nr:PREDICTED: uncharacterized protein LOC109233648 [Nicotiana attenuata]